MASVTITITDLPAGDPRGNLTFMSNTDPAVTPEQLAGKVEFTPAQQVGNALLGVINRLLQPPVAREEGANVIDVAPNAEGVLEVKP